MTELCLPYYSLSITRPLRDLALRTSDGPSHGSFARVLLADPYLPGSSRSASRRCAIYKYHRRHRDHLPDRGLPSILQRSPPLSPRRQPRRRPVPLVRKSQNMGSYVPSHLHLHLVSTAEILTDQGDDLNTLPASSILVCSALSKMVASLATYPHEVLRTRLQIRRSQPFASASIVPPTSIPSPTSSSALYSPIVTGSDFPRPRLDRSEVSQVKSTSRWHPRKDGVVETFMKIKRQDGWRGFYRGLSINLVRTVPNSAVTMLT